MTNAVLLLYMRWDIIDMASSKTKPDALAALTMGTTDGEHH